MVDPSTQTENINLHKDCQLMCRGKNDTNTLHIAEG